MEWQERRWSGLLILNLGLARGLCAFAFYDIAGIALAAGEICRAALDGQPGAAVPT